MGQKNSRIGVVDDGVAVDPASVRTKLRSVIALAGAANRAELASLGPSDPDLAPAENAPAPADHRPFIMQRRVMSGSRVLEGIGSGVLQDQPKNIFGPGHAFSPDCYADIHAAKPYLGWLLEFGKLHREDQQAAFETYVYFQGKMGVLLRQCDVYAQLDNIPALYEAIGKTVYGLFNMPHLRIWKFDGRQAVCVLNGNREDAQVGRAMPALGSLAGDVARGKKVQICKDAAKDSRFSSWQYQEMQATQQDPLGTVMAAPLMSTDADEKLVCHTVIEAYTPDTVRCSWTEECQGVAVVLRCITSDCVSWVSGRRTRPSTALIHS